VVCYTKFPGPANAAYRKMHIQISEARFIVAGGCLPQHSENAAVFDLKDLPWCTILACACGFHEFQNVPTIHHLAEDHVLPIQLGTCAEGDIKLACVAVLSRVGHAHHPRGSMFQLEGSLFVVELSTVDQFSSRSVVVHKVASLANESFFHAKRTGNRDSGVVCPLFSPFPFSSPVTRDRTFSLALDATSSRASITILDIAKGGGGSHRRFLGFVVDVPALLGRSVSVRRPVVLRTASIPSVDGR